MQYKLLLSKFQFWLSWKIITDRSLWLDVSSYVEFHFVCSSAWPRYRVLRSSDIGQNNLEISNAELSDDSLYECQATEAALRSRRAKLSVLGKTSYQWFVCVICSFEGLMRTVLVYVNAAKVKSSFILTAQTALWKEKKTFWNEWNLFIQVKGNL